MQQVCYLLFQEDVCKSEQFNINGRVLGNCIICSALFSPLFFRPRALIPCPRCHPGQKLLPRYCRLFETVLFLFLMPFIQVSKRLILPKPSNRPRETAGKREPTYPVHSVPTSSSLVSSLTGARCEEENNMGSNCR